MSNNVTGVKISQFNVAATIGDADVLPFVSNGANLAITYENLKNGLGVTGVIKPTGSATSVSILSQPSSTVNYIRNVLGSQGVTTTTAAGGEIAIKTNFANDPTGEGLIVDPNAAQTKFKSIVGGINTVVSTVADTVVIDVEDSSPLLSQKIVRDASDFDDPLSPTVQYFIDGHIDMGATQLNVGSGGANINGLSFGVSQISSAANGYTLLNGASVGNVFINDVEIITSGAGSSVFNLTDSDGTHTIEMGGVNFTNCSSLGEINGFRQGLEFNTGRFGGSPNLTMSGTMNGYRVSTSIVRGILNGTDLFTAGIGLLFSGRFISDLNVDMPATGALFDFSDANFVNDESLIISRAFATRNGVADASDATLTPNIDNTSVKSNWDSNTGLPNTRKYLKSVCTSEAATALSGVAINTYLPLAGTFAPSPVVQFDMPANGEYRLLTGNGIYNITGTVQISGTSGDIIDMRVTLSTDGGLTFATEINHIGLEIPNLVGTSDFATFSLNFIYPLKKNQRIRVEVENKTAARDVTCKQESFVIITEV